MIILSAEEPSEKGKAFEEFISILLSRLGYQVTNRRVRKAGRELDILQRHSSGCDLVATVLEPAADV